LPSWPDENKENERNYDEYARYWKRTFHGRHYKSAKLDRTYEFSETLGEKVGEKSSVLSARSGRPTEQPNLPVGILTNGVYGGIYSSIA